MKFQYCYINIEIVYCVPIPLDRDRDIELCLKELRILYQRFSDIISTFIILNYLL